MNRDNPPIFSVVMPVFNKAPHVERAISSVLSQSFTNLELLIVDDASTDESSSRIHQFSDARLRLFKRLAPGAGGYAARNLGVQESRGEWVAFLDADDEWLPGHLEAMEGLTKRFPYVNLMASGWRNKFPDGSVTNNTYFCENRSKGPHMIGADEYLLSCLNNNNPIHTNVLCFRKTAGFSDGLFPEKSGALRGGDLYAWMRLLGKNGHLAWSNHLGAIYHRDSVNMVTKSAPSGPELFGKHQYSKLSVDSVSSTLLKRYMNKKLLEGWRGNIARRVLPRFHGHTHKG